jgi:phosphonate transport system substrate-binding protein
MMVLRRRNKERRKLLIAGAGLLVASRAASAPSALRFGTTPVFLDNHLALLSAWQTYLEGVLGRPVHFVQRRSYREITDLLLSDGIDVAWVCGPPFVVHESRLELVAVPVYQGAPLYRSHLVVPASDTRTRSILDLRGKVFAYSDPHSNSGCLVPRVELIRANESPEAFFRRSFYTYAHRKVVEAVKAGIAQGGAVDGYVWDTLEIQQPDATAGVQVAWRSAQHGFPPIVGRRTLPPDETAAIATALVDMQNTDGGRAILKWLNIDGFTRASPQLFDSIRNSIRLNRGLPG